MQFLTIKQLSIKYPAFSEAAIRALIKCASKNDFYKCVRRINTKIVINDAAFETWIEEHAIKKSLK